MVAYLIGTFVIVFIIVFTTLASLNKVGYIGKKKRR